MYHTKKTGRAAALLLAGILLLGGCSAPKEGTAPGGNSTAQAEPAAAAAMGRYMESAAELPGGMQRAEGISQTDGKIRVTGAQGESFLSADRGDSFAREKLPSAAQNFFASSESESEYPERFISNVNGDCLVSFLETGTEDMWNWKYSRKLVTAENEVIDLTNLPADEKLYLAGGDDGFFYGVSSSMEEQKNGRVYQINPDTGETVFLFREEGQVGYFNVCGRYLLTFTKGRISIYDLEKKELAEQDTVLEDFLKNDLHNYTFTGAYNFLIAPGTEQDTVFVVTEKGIFRHVMYGDIMEQVIDGSLCSIGDVSKSYSGLTAVDGGEKPDVFLLLFSDGSLLRYIYDSSMPTVPDKTLRIYSLYPESNVKAAVSAFQKNHPDIYVKYEVGTEGEDGVSRDDALKNLSTSLASGSGPDVLVMDDLPYASYVKKGVLMDVSDIVAQMQGEDALFENVLEDCREDGRIYAVPMGFQIPLLSGAEDTISGVDSLSGLAGLLEQARAENPEGSLFSFVDGQSLITLLSQTCSGSWIGEDGNLDREALTEFLAQCRRMYDAQSSGIGQKEKDLYYENRVSTLSDNGRNNVYNSIDAISSASQGVYLKQPFSAGIFSGETQEFSFYSSILRSVGGSFVRLPGQNGNVGLPFARLGINRAAKLPEEAQEFFRYALSREFQSASYIGGVTMNRAAFYEKQKFDGSDGNDRSQPFGTMGIIDENGVASNVDIYFPSQEDFDILNRLVEETRNITSCDSRVMEAVAELGDAAVSGESSIEEAVDEIEKKVGLYLAE